MRLTNALLVSIVFLLAAAAAQPVLAGESEALDQRIAEFIGQEQFKHAHWGILISDLESGDVVYEHQADKLFAPASTTKLFSVAAALVALGADYRFETPLYADGNVDDAGVLQGNLVLVASGDLSLGGRTDAEGHIAFKSSDHTYATFGDGAELTEPDPLAGLNELARQVAAAGIKRVEGNVLVDDRLFEPAQGTGSGPSRLTPIMVNDNLLDFVITPAAAGSPATVDWRPQTAAWQIDARVETAPAGGETRITLQALDHRRVVIRGQVPEGRAPLVRIYEVPDAASFARSLLIEALARAAVKVDASLHETNPAELLPARASYSSLRRVAALTSPPLAESLRLILKVSHNLHASTLPLLIAAKEGRRTLADGLHLQHDLLAGLGVDVDTISFGGAAGGDRADYVTPRATVQLLRSMAARPDFAAYESGLPVLGEDGTLSTAVPSESPVRGKVQAKTGTLLWSNVMNGGHVLTSKALAGYATTAAGRRLAFAMFVNQVHLKNSGDREQVGQALGRLCEIMYEAP